MKTVSLKSLKSYSSQVSLAEVGPKLTGPNSWLGVNQHWLQGAVLIYISLGYGSLDFPKTGAYHITAHGIWEHRNCQTD